MVTKFTILKIVRDTDNVEFKLDDPVLVNCVTQFDLNEYNPQIKKFNKNGTVVLRATLSPRAYSPRFFKVALANIEHYSYPRYTELFQQYCSENKEAIL